jgi:ribonuclease P protein component
VRSGKGARLRQRREFLQVQERGRKLNAGAYVVLALENGLGRARLGVTVTTRIGNAVVRNRVKRWVREAFRAEAPELPSMDVVVIARSSAPQAGLAGARRALAAARAAGGGRA